MKAAIPMVRITLDEVHAAIGARNDVVHDAQYDSSESNVRLWRHVSILRELVLRIILTLLGYKGRYASFLDGFKWRNFPPAEDDEVKPPKLPTGQPGGSPEPQPSKT
jgi:hypothetical protein